MIDIKEILSILPHRCPFVLVDKGLEIEPKKSAVAIQNVTINEPFFQGHFPGNPIMPGVLILEAMAQVCVIVIKYKENAENKLGVFTGIDTCKIRRMVVPGDTLTIKVEMTRLRSSIGKAQAYAYVGEELACEAELSFAIIDA